MSMFSDLNKIKGDRRPSESNNAYFRSEIFQKYLLSTLTARYF